VPEPGLCARSTLPHFPTGTHCESVGTADGSADFDCVVASAISGDEQGTAPEEIPVQPGEDTDGVDDPTPVETTGGAPLPSVQKGGAGPAEDYSAGGGSCQGGPSSVLALALAGVMLLLRRTSKPTR